MRIRFSPLTPDRTELISPLFGGVCVVGCVVGILGRSLLMTCVDFLGVYLDGHPPASQEFSKGLVRPDPLLYLGSWRVGRPGKSA